MKAIIAMITMLVLMASTVSAMDCLGCMPQCPEGSFYAAGDPAAFANTVADEYGSVTNSGNAVGMDDGLYAVIAATNPDSFIVLDMGEGEELWGWFGIDLKVYQDGSAENFVNVYVSNDPTSGFEWVGTLDGTGVGNLNIEGTSYSSVRYVKIVSGALVLNAEIDAVEGVCISEPGNEVPEFGTIGAALALLGAAGFVAYKKRK
ncbi:hypothetical protein JXB02_01155 [Candidatus Woesearchaeota archaeon]|nr:hypothetical protein [Candidatus Woesearchaeota archaeon]